MQIEPAEQVVPYLVQTIKQHLENGEKVLWLVSGGSGIAVSSEVSKQLVGSDLTGLYVTLTDERYVPFGSKDENWQQLLEAGFDLPGATTYRVIQEDAVNREITASAFEKTLEDWLDIADFSIGLFGIGPDGHTSGIKPGSPAVSEERWVSEYQGEDFERITTTPLFIPQLDEVVTYAAGKPKFETLAKLIHENVPVDEQPAQVLKEAAKSILFTDYMEEK